MADQLTARLSVDTSSFKAGMAEAASSTRTLKDASAELKIALSNLAEAESAFGASAAGGNQQAATALAGYREEARRAEQAVSQLGASEVRETAALRSSISARMAASAEMRVLEMNTQGSTRAAGALIAQIPGLSTFAQAIFPLFGIAALVGVGVEVGDALAKAFDLGGERARALRKDIQDVNNELNHSITSLDVQIDKLQQEQAKLEKKPFNGMKLVLDEAAEAAQNLADKLDSVIQREAKVISAEAASIPQKILLGGTGTKYEQTMLEEHTKWLNQAVNEQQQLNESASFGNSLQTRLNELKGLQADADARSASAASAGAYAARVNYDNEIKAVQDLMAYQQREQTLVQKSIDLNKQQAATQHARDTHTSGGGNADDKAARERLKKMEDDRTAEENEGKLGAQADLDYWTSRVNAFKNGSDEYKAVQEKIIHDRAELARANEGYNQELARGAEISAKNAQTKAVASVEYDVAAGKITKLAADEKIAAIEAEGYTQKLTALREELAKIQADKSITPEERGGKALGVENQISETEGSRVAAAMQEAAKVAHDLQEEKDKLAEATEKLAAEESKHSEILAQNKRAMELERIAVAEVDGALTPLRAAQQKAGVDAEVYRQKIQALRGELEKLKEAEKALQPGSADLRSNQAQQTGLQNQILGVQGQAGVSGMKDQTAIAQQTAAPYIKAADTIEEAFTRAFTEVALKQKSWEKAMAGTLVSLELSAAQAVEKWVLKWTAAEILTLTKHVTTNQMKVASDQLTAAEGGAIQVTAGMMEAIQGTKNVVGHAADNQLKVANDQIAASESGAIQMEAGMKEALIDAKNAAVKGWKAGMALPFPEDIVMAPVLAAAGFAGAMAQFEVGTNFVPKTGIYGLHEGERVIPAADNRQLMGALQGGGSASRSSTTNVRSTINNHYNNPGKPPSAREQAAAVRNLVRRGHV